MTVNLDIQFSQRSLRTMRDEFKKLLPAKALEGLFTIKQSSLTKSKKFYEVRLPKNTYFPNGYYWCGTANNAYEAKTKLIQIIINRIERSEFEDEMFPIMKP